MTESALPNQSSRILIIRPGAIGDTVLSLTSFKLLTDRYCTKQPGKADFIVSPQAVAVIEKFTERENLEGNILSLEDRRLLPLFSESDYEVPELLKDLYYDLVCYYSKTPDPSLEKKLNTVSETCIHIHSFQSGDADFQWRFLANQTHAVSLHRLESPAGDFKPAPYQCEKLKQSETSRTRLYIHPGAGSTRKKYPAYFYTEVAVKFQTTLNGTVEFFTGPADEESENEIKATLPDAVINRLSLQDLIQTLCDAPGRSGTDTFFFCNDSAFAHLAACAGLSGCVLFLTTNPSVWLPASLPGQVIPVETGNNNRNQVFDQVLESITRLSLGNRNRNRQSLS